MELTGGRGADVIITATAATGTQEQAIAVAARHGRISVAGGLPTTNPTITCDSNAVHYRQLHIHGANGSAPVHNKRAPEYISTGQAPVKDLITRHIPLSGVMDAFGIVERGEAIKVRVEPQPAAGGVRRTWLHRNHWFCCESVTSPRPQQGWSAGFTGEPVIPGADETTRVTRGRSAPRARP